MAASPEWFTYDELWRDHKIKRGDLDNAVNDGLVRYTVVENKTLYFAFDVVKNFAIPNDSLTDDVKAAVVAAAISGDSIPQNVVTPNWLSRRR